MCLLGAAEILEATRDAVSVLQEHAGDSVDEQLAAAGFDAQGVADAAYERWRASEEDERTRFELFARGFVEGLLSGRRLR